MTKKWTEDVYFLIIGWEKEKKENFHSHRLQINNLE